MAASASVTAGSASIHLASASAIPTGTTGAWAFAASGTRTAITASSETAFGPRTIATSPIAARITTAAAIRIPTGGTIPRGADYRAGSRTTAGTIPITTATDPAATSPIATAWSI